MRFKADRICSGLSGPILLFVTCLLKLPAGLGDEFEDDWCGLLLLETMMIESSDLFMECLLDDAV